MELLLTKETDFSPYKNKRLLGLDVGDKTIGISVCDRLWTIASPLLLIERKNIAKDLEKLLGVFEKEAASMMVVGLPLNMNGSLGPQAQKVQKLMDKVQQVNDIPVVYWDERLSTIAVTKAMIEADLSRKKRDKVVDKMAATFILQGFIDGWRG
ncbi:MAG TPA: Holliday junction resolvase RuvX [Alphaproteobacteria bacterium]|nr:Holliday junction resolvase RuvX [Alphaproteobacteria bacterium]